MEKAKTSGNLRVIASTSFLSGLSYSILQVVWQPFVLSQGAPMSALGMLESLGGRRGVVVTLIQLVSGWFSDRLGRKPFIALGSLVGFLAISLCALAAIIGEWRLLLPGGILLGAGLASRPAESSLIAESVRASRRGMAFSILMASWIAPGILAPALGGYIADHWCASDWRACACCSSSGCL